jgi:outer membrane protein assembly factor BamB
MIAYRLLKGSQMTRIALVCSLMLLQWITSITLACAQTWPSFRGGDANGVSLNSKIPDKWSESENVAWKTAIHGRGWSSPVVQGNEVWLTTATEDGLKMYAVCIDLKSGKIIHDQLLFENDSVQKDFHVTNTYASSTPVIDGESVYVHFGAYGTAKIKRSDCSKVWERRDLPCNHYRGAGSSPIVYKDKLIFHMDGFDHQYAVALDCQTGETLWKKDREVDYGSTDGDVFKAFSTPLIINVGGKDQMISPASKACIALDPNSGKELWRVGYSEHSTTVRPVFDGSRLYLSTGFSKAQMMCVRVDGTGDVTKTHVDWMQSKGIGSKPSPVLVNGKLFDVTDDGVLGRIDLKNGEIVWKQRLGGKFSASLVATEDKLVALDHDGKGYVFSVADEPQLLGENSLPDGCNASPALVGNSLILRTTTALYKIVP